MRLRLCAVVMLAACSGSDKDGTSTPLDGDMPFPDCLVTVDAATGESTTLERIFVDGELVEDVGVATYTYESGRLKTLTTTDEVWTYSYGGNGPTAIDITDAATGAKLRTRAYFYNGVELVDVVDQLLDGTVGGVIGFEWDDPLLSTQGGLESRYVETTLRPPILDLVFDPPDKMLVVEREVMRSQQPIDEAVFERDVGADGIPTEERGYERGVLSWTRSWTFCQ